MDAAKKENFGYKTVRAEWEKNYGEKEMAPMSIKERVDGILHFSGNFRIYERCKDMRTMFTVEESNLFCVFAGKVQVKCDFYFGGQEWSH